MMRKSCLRNLQANVGTTSEKELLNQLRERGETVLKKYSSEK